MGSLGASSMSSDPIKVDVDPSGMRAFVTVNPASEAVSEEDQLPIFPETILRELKEAGVTNGIDEEAIRAIVAEKKWGERVEVARGKPPVQGEDGSVEYFFETDPKPHPRELDGNRVDYREIDLINDVAKDALLARRIPPKPGRIGMTVQGDAVEGRNGKEVFIKAGLNTYFADGKDLELRAATTGSVSLRAGVVHVENVLTAKDGVNFASGNIDFPGDVVIDGDVMTGFSVRSGGKVEVRGVVEDACLEARGNVLVKGGFKGSGRGKIRAGGDVFVKFVENQSVEAEGSVHIGNTCVHARINAGDKIELSTGSGAVIGGHLRAKQAIIAKVLGNNLYASTTVEIMADPFDQQQVGGECPGRVQALQKVYPGVKIIIGGLEFSPEEEYGRAEFRKIGDEVVNVTAPSPAVA